MKGAARVRNKFKNEDVSVVVAADESFLRFHESSSELLAPKGVKRVGTAIKRNEKKDVHLCSRRKRYPQNCYINLIYLKANSVRRE